MPGLVPPSTLEQIRAASDIVEIVGSYLGRLQRAGANFRALCPFHKEKTPSFNVNPQKQIFYCFGCHKGGDVFAFVKEYENIGFMDAVRRLAERAKIPLELENVAGQQEARHIKDQLLQIHEQITQRWQAALANDAAGQIARDYLQKRQVSEEAVKLFRLGYAPDLWDDTVNWSKSKGYDLTLMEQSGLIIKKEESGHHYDRFRGRLIFPICDEQGRVIGFSGRVLTGDGETAKYVNSSETPIFHKGKIFFGLDKSKRPLLDAGFAVICEGQLDLIACYMAGVKNIVAAQGTAFTLDHARILKRYVDEVVLCFDSDSAGQKATVRVLDSLLAVGLTIRVAPVPKPHDPDTFIKANGGAAFQKLIESGGDFFDYFLNWLCDTNDITSDKGRLAVVRAMAQNLNKTDSAVLSDTYAQKTAARIGVSAESIRSEFKKMPRTRETIKEDDTIPTESIARPSQQEFWLLKLLLQTDDHVEWVLSHLDLEWVENKTVRFLVNSRLRAQEEGSWSSVAAWLSQIEDSAAQCLVGEALAEDRRGVNAETLLKGAPGKPGILQILRDKFVDRQMAAITQKLSRPNLPEAEFAELSRQKITLRQMKQQPLAARGEV